jgi:hypothetical protein
MRNLHGAETADQHQDGDCCANAAEKKCKQGFGRSEVQGKQTGVSAEGQYRKSKGHNPCERKGAAKGLPAVKYVPIRWIEAHGNTVNEVDETAKGQGGSFRASSPSWKSDPNPAGSFNPQKMR